MSSRPRRNWKGCCAMCAANKGKMRDLPWADRRPAKEVRRLGLKSTRGMRRKDIGDAMDY